MTKNALIGFVIGAVAGVAAVMLYLHRKSLVALVKGEKMPEAPESCPFSKAEDELDDLDELEV